jgi:thioredoxin-like negative regulator of GroEL
VVAAAAQSLPLLLALPLGACAPTTSASPAPPVASAVHVAPQPEPTVDPPAQAPASAASPGRKPGGKEEPIVFVEDDYDAALAEAKARHVPLFVDAWAPWCHTCQSMRSFVFPDPELRRYAARFVWLAIDTERESNAAVVNKLGLHVLPTLYVIDPFSEQPVVAWPGSLTAVELAALLDDAEVATTRRDAGGEAMAALLRGRQASATGQHEDAIAAYRQALATAPPRWSKRAMAVDGLVTELDESGQLASCVTTGADEAPHMPAGSALADVLRTAMHCAGELPKDAAERARWRELVSVGERVANDRSQPILGDDRSDLYSYVVEGLRELRKTDEARRVARAWASMLEAQASRAASPAARTVFDAHRLLAYIAIGEPQRAVPMLQLSERDFPDDYNPPARLAVAYLEMKHYDDGLAAVQRALSRAYGPRKLRLWTLQADLCEAKGDRAGAARALREARDFAKALPLTGNYPKLLEVIEKRLEGIEKHIASAR